MPEVVLSDEAVRHFKLIPKSERPFVKDGIRIHLAEADPAQSSRSKFRLRRASPYAEFELRLDRWRVYYRLGQNRVEVTMIGEKRGNLLFIGGEEFRL